MFKVALSTINLAITLSRFVLVMKISKFDDTSGVIRSGKLKDRKYNGQKNDKKMKLLTITVKTFYSKKNALLSQIIRNYWILIFLYE